MKILIITIGKVSSKDPEEKIIREYLKRIPWKIELKQFETESSLKKTSEKMLKIIPKGYHPILLNEIGKNYSSKKFMSYLNSLCNININKIAFLIGGAEGFHKNIFDNIKNTISLGNMTYSHKLAKIILVEQLYRTWTIMSNHPYSR